MFPFKLQIDMDSTCINDPMMSTLLASNFLHLDNTNQNVQQNNSQLTNSASLGINTGNGLNQHMAHSTPQASYNSYGLPSINNQYTNLSNYSNNYSNCGSYGSSQTGNTSNLYGNFNGIDSNSMYNHQINSHHNTNSFSHQNTNS